MNAEKLYKKCPKCQGGRVERVPLIENPIESDDRTVLIRCRNCDGEGYVLAHPQMVAGESL